jgi:hypothetical protein
VLTNAVLSFTAVGHFTQHHTDNFNLSLSAVENLLNMFKSTEDQEMRSFLGRFQIQGTVRTHTIRYRTFGMIICVLLCLIFVLALLYTGTYLRRML